MTITRPPTTEPFALANGHETAHTEIADALEGSAFSAPAPSGGNDTTAVQAVLTAAGALTGGSSNNGTTVMLRSGVYSVSKLLVPTGVTLAGMGRWATSVRSIASNPESAVIQLASLTGGGDIGLRDLNVNGVKSSQSVAVDGVLIDNTGSPGTDRRHILFNVWVQSCSGSGFHLVNADNSSLQLCRAQANDEYNLRIGGSSADVAVYGFEGYLAGLHGVWVESGSNNGWFANCKIGNSGQVDATTSGDNWRIDAVNVQLDGCQSQRGERDGLSLNNSRIVVDGMVFDDDARYMVNQVSGTNNSVTATMVDSGTADSDAVVNITGGTLGRIRFYNDVPAAYTGGVQVSGTTGTNYVQVGPTVTKGIFLSTRNALTDSSTASARGTAPDATALTSLADAATQGTTFFPVQIPRDAKPASPLNIVLSWEAGTTDASAHTVAWSVDALILSSGVAANATGATTAFTGTSSAHTQFQMFYEPATQILASANPGDVIRLNVRRVGADGADTYVGAVEQVGAELQYTAFV